MKTNSVNPKEDIQAIREIMERSSKFMLLNSWAGFFAGTCALIGAAVAWFFILGSGSIHYDEFLYSVGNSPINNITVGLGIDALLVLFLAGVAAIYFSYRKSLKAGQKFWTSSTKRVLMHLLIPLVSGGIFALILVFRNNIELVASVTLIFYGLALVNAGIFVNQGLLFWTVGFGLVHFIYGTVMYYKHER